MECLSDYLRDHAEGDLLPWRCQVEAATRFSLSLARAEEAILELGLLPARYQRNRQAFTTGQQLQLFRSRVAVIGCGGLGGYIIEELARLAGSQTGVASSEFILACARWCYGDCRSRRVV